MKPTDEQHRATAKHLYHNEGSIEIDNLAPISQSGGEKGAYVQAWVWVSNDDIIP